MNLAAIPTFASDDIFHVIVEAPRGSPLKLKYEPRWEAMSRSCRGGLAFSCCAGCQGERYPGDYPRPRTGPRVDHALPVDKT